MLLQQITLNNIRSYTNQTIIFPEGSILLSGDIGVGKSSLLLAIEFALFGSSRSNLPAESLLRKGSTNGSVELHFLLEKQKIIIKRNLKKDKDSIKQLSGHIIINDLKKELTPVELKAEIINLLGYPEDLISKNKNYIFRYTVYTPQEGMKLILYESSEIRQDVLRRIFNIDKYKKIRENLQVYLRQMRTNIAILKTKIEPLEETDELLKKLTFEKESIQKSLGIIKPQLENIQKNKENLQLEIEHLEKEHKLFQELKQQRETNFIIIKEKKEQILSLEQKDELITLKIVDLQVPLGRSLEQIKEDIRKIDEDKNELLTKKTTLQEKLNLLQQQIQESKQDLSKSENTHIIIKEKEEEKLKLKEIVHKKNEFTDQKNKLKELIEQTFVSITKNKTFREQAQEIQIKVNSLDNCPSCLQLVSSEHKLKITTQQQEKLSFAEKVLTELAEKRSELEEKNNLLEKELEEISKKENLLLKIKLELQQLYEDSKKMIQKRENLKSKIQENNLLMQELVIVQNKEKNYILENKKQELQKILDALSNKQFLEKQSQELELQIKHNKQLLLSLNTKLEEIILKLKDKKDCLHLINEKRSVLTKIIDEEKEQAVKKASLQTQLNSLTLQENDLQIKFDLLTKEKNKSIKLKKLHHWLEDFFSPLTHTIEKQIMVNIHYVFNQVFQEWFSILIDDDNMNARIDDSFTPVIEQNGYEVLFTNLSGGEKTSAALAYRLALNRVINEVIHTIKTKDLLILDEPTDGFSYEQLDKIRNVLEKLQLQQTIIVSHESKIESFVENVIRVGKNGSISLVN